MITRKVILKMKVFVRGVVDFLFGYDFFISYSHADGGLYPKRLLEELESLGFTVFLDTRDYQAGEDLRTGTRRRVRMSKKLIVVLGKNAVKSYWVGREIEAFIERGSNPIVIDLNDTLSKSDTKLEVVKLLDDHIYIPERVKGEENNPGKATIERILGTFKSTRRETVRMRWITGTVVVLAVFIILMVWLGMYSLNKRREVETGQIIFKTEAKAAALNAAQGAQVLALFGDQPQVVVTESIHSYERIVKSGQKFDDPEIRLNTAAALHAAIGAHNSGFIKVPGEYDSCTISSMGNYVVARNKRSSVRDTRRLWAIKLSNFEKKELKGANDYSRRAFSLPEHGEVVEVEGSHSIQLFKLETGELLGEWPKKGRASLIYLPNSKQFLLRQDSEAYMVSTKKKNVHTSGTRVLLIGGQDVVVVVDPREKYLLSFNDKSAAVSRISSGEIVWDNVKKQEEKWRINKIHSGFWWQGKAHVVCEQGTDPGEKIKVVLLSISPGDGDIISKIAPDEIQKGEIRSVFYFGSGLLGYQKKMKTLDIHDISRNRVRGFYPWLHPVKKFEDAQSSLGRIFGYYFKGNLLTLMKCSETGSIGFLDLKADSPINIKNISKTSSSDSVCCLLRNGEIFVWRPIKRLEKGRIPTGNFSRNTYNPAIEIVQRGDSEILARVQSRTQCKLWRSKDGSKWKEADFKPEISCYLSEDGRWCVFTGGKDVNTGKKVKGGIWDMESDRLVLELELKDQHLQAVSFSKSGETVGIVSGEDLVVIKGPGSSPRIILHKSLSLRFYDLDVAVRSDGKELSAAFRSNYLKRWKLVEPVVELEPLKTRVDRMDFVRYVDDDTVLCASFKDYGAWSSRAILYRLSDGKMLRNTKLRAHGGNPVKHIAVSPTKKHVLILVSHVYYCWDLTTLKLIYTVRLINRRMTAAFTKSGDSFWLRSPDGRSELRETRTGRVMLKIKQGSFRYRNTSNNLIMQGGGNLFCSFAENGDVILYEDDPEKLVKVVRRLVSAVIYVADLLPGPFSIFQPYGYPGRC